MPYDLEVVAWEGWPRRGQSRGNRYAVEYDRQGRAILPRASRVHRVHVILNNPNRQGDSHRLWIGNINRNDPFTKWGQWFAFIIAIGEDNHNYSFIDEAIPPDESYVVE